MPGKNKTPLLGWHPASAESAAWARAEAERRGIPLARILDEALADYMRAHPAEPERPEPGDQDRPGSRIHPGADALESEDQEAEQ